MTILLAAIIILNKSYLNGIQKFGTISIDTTEKLMVNDSIELIIDVKSS